MRPSFERLTKIEDPIDWISSLTNHLFRENLRGKSCYGPIILNDFSTGLCILKGEVRGSGKSASSAEKEYARTY